MLGKYFRVGDEDVLCRTFFSSHWRSLVTMGRFSAQFPWNGERILRIFSVERRRKDFSWWRNFTKFFLGEKLYSFSRFMKLISFSLFPRFSLVVTQRKKEDFKWMFMSFIQLLYHRHFKRHKRKTEATRDLRWWYWFLFSPFFCFYFLIVGLASPKKRLTATERYKTSRRSKQR